LLCEYAVLKAEARKNTISRGLIFLILRVRANRADHFEINEKESRENVLE
jgi:hypothetical protein